MHPVKWGHAHATTSRILPRLQVLDAQAIDGARKANGRERVLQLQAPDRIDIS